MKKNIKTYHRFAINDYLVDQLSKLPSKKKTYQRNERIIEEGQRVRFFAVINQGLVKSVFKNHAGEEEVNFYSYPGQTFPENLIFSGISTYPYDLLALKKTQITYYALDDFIDLLENDTIASISLIEYMAERSYKEALWRRCNQQRTARAKLAAMLAYIYEATEGTWVRISDTQDIIANKLQVSRPTLNQEINRLEEDGLIKRETGLILVVDEEALYQEI